jgi:hypothetical protein
MRKVIFLLIIILFLPTILWASDPIIGTWKLNVAKSTVPHKEYTEIYKEVGEDRIELTRFGIHGFGTKFNEKLTWPRQGGVVVLEGAEIGVELFIKASEWYGVYLTDGKWWILHKVISEDGKTMYMTNNRYDPQGNPIVEKGIFDRQ